MNEWLRLRQDFEREASRYHDLRLMTYFITPEDIIGGEKTFPKPNHEIILFKYLGNEMSDLEKPELTAFGVIIGEQTNLFRRMAYRAGSLLPDELQLILLRAVTEKFLVKNKTGKPIYSLNHDPLAIWLIFILTITSTIQPNRMGSTALYVDPFVASLTAIDYILDWHPKYDKSKSMGKNNSAIVAIEDMQFSVCLSFPGEKRDFIERIAIALDDELRGHIFYDKWFEAELARPDLDLVLQRIYHDQSSLVAVFICRAFKEKEWCGLEWRALRDLIKRKRGEKIMIFRFDDVDIPGLLSIDGYIDLNNRLAQDVVALIRSRLQVIENDKRKK
jgi:hypothetical protein